MNYKKIVSLGSGSCVLEDILSKCIPSDCTITCLEIRESLVNAASKYFHNLNPIVFDMTKDSIKENFDVAFFFSCSSYLSSKQYLRMLKQLRDSGVKEIIDWSGYLRMSRCIKSFIGSFLIHNNKTIQNKHICLYMKSLRELKRIYKTVGAEIVYKQNIDSSIGLQNAIFVLRFKGICNDKK